MPKNFVVFAYTYVSKSSALLNDYFCMNSHDVDSNEVMKRGDEVKRFIASIFKKRLTLHRYVFLLSVKRFIAVTF